MNKIYQNQNDIQQQMYSYNQTDNKNRKIKVNRKYENTDGHLQDHDVDNQVRNFGPQEKQNATSFGEDGPGR